MGGCITVESGRGQGSTFSFSVHLQVSERQHQAVSMSSLRSLRRLLVEDNQTNRQILAQTLDRWQMKVFTAASADEAMRLLKQHHERDQIFDVVVTDVNMPDTDGITLCQHIRSEYDDLPVMALTSGDRPDEVKQLRKLNVRSRLLKPVRQSDLRAALAISIKSQEPSDDGSQDAAIKEIPPSKILLAEDGLANQKLAVGLLTKWGHEVTVANNGREAVEKLADGNFDIVLMDVQMPEMDGLEATRTIRLSEAGSSRHVPIIALTARAMKGDREKCLEAGMDDYVSKPIHKKELNHAMALAIHQNVSGRQAEVATYPGGSKLSECPDWSAAIKDVGGSRDLMLDVIKVFEQQYPQLLGQLETALEQGDAEAVYRVGSILKSTLRTFHAPTLQKWAACVEEAGRQGRLKDAAHLTVGLKHTLDGLIEQIDKFKKQA